MINQQALILLTLFHALVRFPLQIELTWIIMLLKPVKSISVAVRINRLLVFFQASDFQIIPARISVID